MTNSSLNDIRLKALSYGFQADIMGNCVQVTAHLSESTIVLQTADIGALKFFNATVDTARSLGL